MKLIFLIIGSILFAQTIEVTYEATSKIDPKSITVNGGKDIDVEKEQIRSAEELNSLVDYYKLTTEFTQSNYAFIPKLDNSQDDGTKWINGEEGEILYIDTREKISLQTRTYFGKKFIVKDTIDERNWKVTRKKRTICGYQTYKAEIETDSLKVEAWFAPKIQFKTGPINYFGLPGLILEVNEFFNEKSEEGNTSYKYTCKKLEVLEKPKKIKIPKKGKMVSNQQVDQMFLEYQQKYREANAQDVDTSD